MATICEKIIELLHKQETFAVKEGCTKQQLSRVNAPIGRDIGAEAPEEIAVSLMAEMVQRRRLGSSKPTNEG